MPELPEVEATRRFLEPLLSGARITGVEVERERMVRRQPRPRDFADRLVGRSVLRLGRHGKFLLTDLADDIVWATHLGMSGRVATGRPGEPRAPHTNVVVTLDRELEFRLIDPRTFGFVAAFTPEEYASTPMARLGPDALTDLPRSPRLAQRLRNRTAPIKALLLDQTFLAGLGNIYADEVLHRAGVRGDRPGGSLSSREVSAIRNAIRPVLKAGLAWGGTSLEDLAYLLPNGQAGDFTSRLRVYGREDEPCPRCGEPIRRGVIRARSTFFCARCQT